MYLHYLFFFSILITFGCNHNSDNPFHDLRKPAFFYNWDFAYGGLYVVDFEKADYIGKINIYDKYISVHSPSVDKNNNLLYCTGLKIKNYKERNEYVVFTIDLNTCAFVEFYSIIGLRLRESSKIPDTNLLACFSQSCTDTNPVNPYSIIRIDLSDDMVIDSMKITSNLVELDKPYVDPQFLTTSNDGRWAAFFNADVSKKQALFIADFLQDTIKEILVDYVLLAPTFSFNNKYLFFYSYESGKLFRYTISTGVLDNFFSISNFISPYFLKFVAVPNSNDMIFFHWISNNTDLTYLYTISETGVITLRNTFNCKISNLYDFVNDSTLCLQKDVPDLDNQGPNYMVDSKFYFLNIYDWTIADSTQLVAPKSTFIPTQQMFIRR